MGIIIGLLGIGAVAWLADRLIEKLRLPGLLGIMGAGMLLGPYVLDFVPVGALAFSGTFRDVALVAVLFIGGLGVSKSQLQKIGRPAVLLSTVPAVLEGLAIAWATTWWLGFSFVQGAILGFMIAAVSPAVLIPGMTGLIWRGLGTDKGIPQMLLVGASADDTVAITLFTSFLVVYFGEGSPLLTVLQIPISIFLSLATAVLIFKCSKGVLLRFSPGWFRTLFAFGICVLLRMVETRWHVEIFNSLLAVVAFGYLMRNELDFDATYMSKIWNVGRLYLFAFVGMLINPALVGDVFLVGLGILAFSLTVRSVGVWLSVLGTDLTWQERLFCVVAYLPKATVQAVKAPIPLALGVAGGEVMEALAILAILVTAPIGAVGIRFFSRRWLK